MLTLAQLEARLARLDAASSRAAPLAPVAAAVARSADPVAQLLNQALGELLPGAAVLSWDRRRPGLVAGQMAADGLVFHFRCDANQIAYRPAWDGLSQGRWEARSAGFLAARSPGLRLDAPGAGGKKRCSRGYGCGSTCISLQKECRSKPGSSISQERLKRLQQLAQGEVAPRGLGVPRGAAATALATDIQGRRNARAQELLAGRQANRQVKPLAPAQAKTLQPTVVDVEVMPSSGGLAITRQPAAGGLATPGAAAGPRPGSVAAAMRASIEAMRQLDVQQMSRMANDLFESEWTVERNRQWKKLSKEEAKAQFIAKMGQDMQAERAKIAQQSAAAAAAGSGQAKPGSVAAAMRANIEAMKASDQRMAELNRRVVDLRRKAMALELGDLPDELPQAAPPARRRRQLPKG